MNDAPLCPACGSNRQSSLEKIDLMEQHRQYAPEDEVACERLTAEAQKAAHSYIILRCTACGLEFASPLRAPPSSWYDLAYQALSLYPQTRWEFNASLQDFSGGDSVFEFACGAGAFMQLCAQKGFRAVGVDFSQSAVEECRQKGLDTYVLDISNPLLEKFRNSADQIVAFHLLEHLDQPRLLFEQATQVAKLGARLWIAVPSQLRVSRRNGFVDFLDQPPHHMTRWSRSALEQIGNATGWRLIRFKSQPLPLRAALWSITTSGSRYQNLRREGRLNNRLVERAFRFLSYPSALIRRMTVDRDLTGFSMLACYCRS